MKENPYKKQKFYHDIVEVNKLTKQFSDRTLKLSLLLKSQMKVVARSAKLNLKNLELKSNTN